MKLTWVKKITGWSFAAAVSIACVGFLTNDAIGWGLLCFFVCVVILLGMGTRK